MVQKHDEQLEMFKRFVEESGQALGMADLEGRIVYANAILGNILGETSPENLSGKDVLSFYPADQAGQLREEILPHVTGHDRWVGELSLVDIHGRTTPTIHCVFLIRGDRGEPKFFANIITDISERIRREEELRLHSDQLEILVGRRTAELERNNALLREHIAEHERMEKERARLTAILDNTTDLVGMSSSPDGMNLFMNAAGRRMVGFGEDEDLHSINMSEVHPPWAWKIIQDKGIPTAIVRGVWEGETALLSRDGKERLVSQVLIAHCSADGTLEYLSTIMRDITERKKAEMILSKSENKYSLMFHLNPDPIAITKMATGEIIDVNEAFISWTGYTRAELIGASTKDLHLWINQDDREKIIRLLKSEGEVDGIEIAIGKKNGRFGYGLFSARFIEIDTEIYLVTLAHDITERKRAEEGMHRQNRLLTAVNRILLEMLTGGNAGAVARVCLKVAEELTGSKFGFAGEMSPEGTFTITAMSDAGWENCRIAPATAAAMLRNMTIRGIWGQVILREKSLLVNDPLSFTERAGFPEGHPSLTSFLGVPLKDKDKVVGMIAVANNPAGYTPEHRQDLEALSLAFMEATDRKKAQG